MLTFTDDAVYMEDEVDRDEYVFNDTGILYRGNYSQIGAKPWNYDQVGIYLAHVQWSLHFKTTPFCHKIM